jgi:hypothetical protein
MIQHKTDFYEQIHKTICLGPKVSCQGQGDISLKCFFKQVLPILSFPKKFFYGSPKNPIEIILILCNEWLWNIFHEVKQSFWNKQYGGLLMELLMSMQLIKMS